MNEMVFTKPAGEIIKAIANRDIKVTFVDMNKNKSSQRKWRKMVKEAKKHGNKIKLVHEAK